MPGLGPPVPRTAARRVGGCAGGPDRRSRGRSGPNGGPGYRSARKGRRRAATPAQGGKGVRGERACRAAARGPPSCAELAGDYAKRRTKKPGAFRPRVFPIGAACAAPSMLFYYTAPAAVCQTGLPPRRATGCRQRWPQRCAPAPTGAGGGWGLLPSVRCPLAAAIAGRPAPGVRPAAFTVYQKMKNYQLWSNVSFHG